MKRLNLLTGDETRILKIKKKIDLIFKSNASVFFIVASRISNKNTTRFVVISDIEHTCARVALKREKCS